MKVANLKKRRKETEAGKRNLAALSLTMRTSEP
jgi:hypothetical protein